MSQRQTDRERDRRVIWQTETERNKGMKRIVIMRFEFIPKLR